MNFEPEHLRPAFFQWMRTDRRTPSGGINQEFCDRLTVLLPNVSEQGPLVPRQPRLGPYQHPCVVVAVANVAHFFSRIADDFSMPEEFKTIARNHCAPACFNGADHLKRSVLITKHRPTWPTLERDLRDAYKNGLSSAAKVGPQGLWFESKALDWAAARDKLRAKPQLPVTFNPVVSPPSHTAKGKRHD